MKYTPQSDDRAKLAEWVHQHGKAVRAFLLAMVGRGDVADDLLQEVFRRAWQARSRYVENGNARAYLVRIADRLLVDRWRRAGREVNLDAEQWRQVEPASGPADPAAVIVQEEARQRLSAALARLSPPQRRVLLLRYYAQLSFREIAETMGCPLNTALSHCRRGLAALRQELSEYMQ